MKRDAEDLENIAKIKDTLEAMLKNLNVVHVLQDLEVPVRVGEDMLTWRIKDKQKYYFTSDDELLYGLREFFSDPYLPARLATQIYDLDEDSIFTEAVYVEGDKELGKADDAGSLCDSSVIQVEFKTLDRLKDQRSKYTHLPFEVKKVTLVPVC